MQRRFLLSAGAVAAVFAMATPAHARRGRVRLRSAGIVRGTRVPSGATVLSRDELRVCVELERKLDAIGAELDTQSKRILTSEAELRALDAQLTTLEKTVDVYSQQSVDDFNRQVDAHRTRVDGHNCLLAGYNVQVERHGRMVDDFNARCADKLYYVDDMTAIRAGR